jgi:hypothetical protein
MRNGFDRESNPRPQEVTGADVNFEHRSYHVIGFALASMTAKRTSLLHLTLQTSIEKYEIFHQKFENERRNSTKLKLALVSNLSTLNTCNERSPNYNSLLNEENVPRQVVPPFIDASALFWSNNDYFSLLPQ